jgi:uncharacterized protein YqjF (DUF2071 family)
MPPFLRAEWRHLAMLNFEIDPAVLHPLVPRGTELDSWNGRTHVSVVGFRFLDTSVLGIGIPFHRNFEEVNLRFYVRRKAEDGRRRGVVFVKEIVPRAAIAFVARMLYNENYVALPMSHRIDRGVSYAWRFAGRENSLSLVAEGAPVAMLAGSEEEFIAEHYWGYSVQRDGGTVEYKVEHPRWRIAKANEARLDCDAARLYGPQFAECLGRPPSSAFLADGSAVAVFKGVRLDLGGR